MRAIVAGLTVFLLFLGAQSALACDCDAPALTDALSQADVVFEGQVQTVTAEGADFRVTQHWKGVGDVEELTIGTSSGSCGLAFTQGEVYLVFASLEGAQLRTSVCDRSATMSEAEEDLRSLGPGVVPVDPGEDPEPEPKSPPAEKCSVVAVGAKGSSTPWVMLATLALVMRRRRYP